MPRRSVPTPFTRRSTPTSNAPSYKLRVVMRGLDPRIHQNDQIHRSARIAGSGPAMTKDEPIADEDRDRFLSSSVDVADGRLRGSSGHPGVAADHLALHRAYSQLHLDRGDLALPGHLDGDARRHGWHPRRTALRGR